MDVKWIKLSTALPDHRKIKQIRKLPNGDTIALMWIFLLCLAGDTNDDGLIYITPEVPYTEEMLAAQFDIDINTIRLGLEIFVKFGMLEIENDMYRLYNWEKYQATDKLEKIRDDTRKRVAAYRERQKLAECNVTQRYNVTQSNATDIDIEKDKEKEYKETSTKVDVKKKHKYGEYQNVLLTDEEYGKLQSEFPTDYASRIERLSNYIASTGKPYKSHYATIRNWARNDAQAKQPQKNGTESLHQLDCDSFFADALERTKRYGTK